jgi:hypothetical protein
MLDVDITLTAKARETQPHQLGPGGSQIHLTTFHRLAETLEMGVATNWLGGAGL